MHHTIELKLAKLGLSRQERSAYLMLLQRGSLTAKQLAAHLSIFPHAVYRTAQSLKKHGLLGVVKDFPRTFQAYPPAVSIPAFANKQIDILQKLVGTENDILTPKTYKTGPTKIDLIFGKNAIFNLGADLLFKARYEMVVISIGEEISPSLLLAVRKAKERGVSIKMIAHKYDETNKSILENLKKNGYEIRHFPDWGFHLAIYDCLNSLLIINNPKDTNERVGIKIESAGLSKALRDYFQSVWKKSYIV